MKPAPSSPASRAPGSLCRPDSGSVGLSEPWLGDACLVESGQSSPGHARSAPGKRALGFTLLEVMIAVVILAIGLSSLFTSEAGAIRIAQRARTTTIATLLARCKMAEIEETVQKGNGWPTTSLEERDECCEGGEHKGFRCEWKVERIKLPDVADEDEEEDGDGKSKEGSKSGEKSEGEGKAAPKTGILDQLVDVSKGGEDERMSAITDVLSGGGTASGGSDDEKERGDGGLDYSTGEEEEGMDPIGSMVMGMAFPVMKPAIEEGVRRATVRVLWDEGDKEQEFELTQFLVSEAQLILPEGEDTGDGGTPAAPGQTPAPPGATPAPATGAPR